MYVHCNKCHHEWECTGEDDRECNWCGGGSYILEGETPLKKMDMNEIIKKLKKLNTEESRAIIKKIKKHGLKK